MLWQAIGAVRDLGRVHDIASVLIRYGCGDLVRRIGMSSALERAGKALRWQAPEELAHLEPPARVHRAWLADGSPVVLKIRRPGIRPVIEADLRLLARLAEIVEAAAPELLRYRPREVVRQFTHSLRRELDFSAEGRSAERIAENFAAHPEIVVPHIHWDWTGERLNVQDYIAGIPGRDLAAADAIGLDRKLLARRGAQAVLKMILEDGLFHADPHPGNVFYLGDKRVALIDFGMVGHLSEERRYQLASLLHGLVAHDPARVADVLLDWSKGDDVDTDLLQPEIDAFLDRYHGVALKGLDLAGMLGDAVALLREHRLALPPDLALLMKAFITLEGLGRQLDPDFDMAAEAAPLIQQVLVAHASPLALVRRSRRTLGGLLNLVGGLPGDLRQLLRAARRGKLQIQVEVLPLKELGERLDRAASRLAVAIVTPASPSCFVLRAQAPSSPSCRSRFRTCPHPARPEPGLSDEPPPQNGGGCRRDDARAGLG